MSAPVEHPASGPPPTGVAGPLRIVLACRQCGGPLEVDEDAVSVTCRHCTSLLLLGRPRHEEMLVASDRVGSAAGALEVAILYRVQAQRAVILEGFGSPDHEGQRPGPPEIVLRQMLRLYEERLRRQSAMDEAFRVWAPYWQIGGAIAQAVLGRHHDGPKEVRLRAFAVEHTVPAYDTARADFRDRGLRLARSAVAPLTRAGVRERRAFLPWRPAEAAHDREIEKWRGQELDRTLDPVVRHGEFLGARRVIVYRAYWLARVEVDGPSAWILVDGSFGTLAGHPSADEARALADSVVEDPAPDEDRSRTLIQIGSRCPDCGADQSFDPRSRVHVCASCHRALALRAEGIAVVAHDHALIGETELDAAYLPFWTFAFRATTADGKAVAGLAEWARHLFPLGRPPGFDPRGDLLWIPAFRLLGTEAGDEAFRMLAEWIHVTAALQVDEGKVPLGGAATFQDVEVAEGEAREQAWLALVGMHGHAAAARLNARLLTHDVLGARLDLGPGRLVLVPFQRAADGVAIPGTHVHLGRVLLEGGPALERQRVDVHSIVRD